MSTSTDLDYTRFLRFRDPLATRPLRLAPTVEWLDTEKAFLLAKGQWKPPEPVVMRAKMGGQTTAVLWTTFPPIVCISERVVEVLTEHEITGWATYPVEVFDRKGELLRGYHGFAVTGSECERDRSRSQIIHKPPPTPTGRGYQVYKGLYFDENQWDGSDMFWVHHSGIVVTEKVYRLFKKAKVSNVRFTPLPKVEIDVKLDEYED